MKQTKELETYWFSFNEKNDYCGNWSTDGNIARLENKKIYSWAIDSLNWKWKSIDNIIIYDRYGSKMICIKPGETEFVISDIGRKHWKLGEDFDFYDDLTSLGETVSNTWDAIGNIKRIKKEISQICSMFPAQNYMKFY